MILKRTLQVAVDELAYTHRASHAVRAAQVAGLVSAQGRQAKQPVRVQPELEDAQSRNLRQPANRTHIGT
jgi:hypothetical protein